MAAGIVPDVEARRSALQSSRKAVGASQPLQRTRVSALVGFMVGERKGPG